MEVPTGSHYVLDFQRANGRRRQVLVSLSDEEVPMYNIEHIIWLDDAQPGAADTGVDKTEFVNSEHRLRRSIDKIGSKHRQTIWGRHTGLYDGTGYGNESPSISPHTPTWAVKTPENLEEAVPKFREARADSLFSKRPVEMTPASPVPGAVTTIAGDHETLEEVLRAYAVYEHQRMSSSTGTDKDSIYGLDKAMEKVVVDAVEDLDLSDRMMDVNLGA